MPGQPALFPEVEQFRLTPVLGDAAAISEWTARGERAFHLEIDTGMGRSGVRWDEIDRVRAAADTPQLEGCYTQFHSADRRDGTAEQQLDRFERAVARLVRRPALLHVANRDRKSTRLNSSHLVISYAVFCLKKKKQSSAHAVRNHSR